MSAKEIIRAAVDEAYRAGRVQGFELSAKIVEQLLAFGLGNQAPARIREMQAALDSESSGSVPNEAAR